jgi:hypothetical protein
VSIDKGRAKENKGGVEKEQSKRGYRREKADVRL